MGLMGTGQYLYESREGGAIVRSTGASEGPMYLSAQDAPSGSDPCAISFAVPPTLEQIEQLKREMPPECWPKLDAMLYTTATVMPKPWWEQLSGVKSILLLAAVLGAMALMAGGGKESS